MAIELQEFRCGVSLMYDNADKYEGRAEELGHINPSLEFWLRDNASSYNNALVVGAGFGLSSKQLVAGGATVTSIEPQAGRFYLLEQNVPESTNINKICSDASGTGTLDYFTDNASGAGLNVGYGNEQQSIDIITVDSLNLTLDLMLIYANGQEFDVLDGAVDTITNNPDMKIIIRWIPDFFEDVDAAVTKLNALGKTIKIIHWDNDDTISYKDPSDLELKAVQTADLLLE